MCSVCQKIPYHKFLVAMPLSKFATVFYVRWGAFFLYTFTMNFKNNLHDKIK